MRPFGKSVKLEERRKKAVHMALKEQMSAAEVAKKFGVTVRAVHWWLQWHRGEGQRGIESKQTPGRPSRLTLGQQKQLRNLLLKGAMAAGFDTDLWTCPRIREVIRQRFGIAYHVDHVCRLLHTLGFTPQRPERKAVERDEKAIRQWMGRQWPRIKKKR